MKRFAALGAFALLLGGCALPVPVQIASWALDGISYILTEKSVADHGISLLAQKDCAILRGVLDPGEFCRDLDGAATAVAGAGAGPSTAALAALDPDTRNETLEETEGASELLAELLAGETLAEFDTASGGPAAGGPAAGGPAAGGPAAGGPADAIPAADVLFDYPLDTPPETADVLYDYPLDTPPETAAVLYDYPLDTPPETAAVLYDYPLDTPPETAAVIVELIYIPLVFEDGVSMSDPDATAVETAALMTEPAAPRLVFEDGVPMSVPIYVPPAAAEPFIEAADFEAAPASPAPGPWRAGTETESAGLADNIAEPAVGEPAVGEPAASEPALGEPRSGFYFVIGSFHEHLNARKLRNRYRALTPSVLAARIEKGTVYRVVVGPFDEGHAKDIHKRIYAAGISDSWAIRVTPGEWSMAMIDPPAEAPPLEVAEAGDRSGWTDRALGYIQSLARLIY